MRSCVTCLFPFDSVIPTARHRASLDDLAKAVPRSLRARCGRESRRSTKEPRKTRAASGGTFQGLQCDCVLANTVSVPVQSGPDEALARDAKVVGRMASTCASVEAIQWWRGIRRVVADDVAFAVDVTRLVRRRARRVRSFYKSFDSGANHCSSASPRSSLPYEPAPWSDRQVRSPTR
jgi:hypothetical protein